ncbi:hypothetical protein VSX64_18375 [Aurantimonas sp. C2-6-R+9]|nr:MULTISPECIES: hypothetical protein [unclassified Aurantimonas]MEC5292606.1 hypothetical protein [Aurantimonas sp. C2-3-R2]MEC5382809.1 hypothetical protein [Aurantimonas sp. C2-6-R+9]MEC5413661.1 hypothetical protein [Aurantimonas sp. C2-4-R8]
MSLIATTLPCRDQTAFVPAGSPNQDKAFVFDEADRDEALLSVLLATIFFLSAEAFENPGRAHHVDTALAKHLLAFFLIPFKLHRWPHGFLAMEFGA